MFEAHELREMIDAAMMPLQARTNGEGRAGQGRAGQGKAGQGRARQGRAGEGGMGRDEG